MRTILQSMLQTVFVPQQAKGDVANGVRPQQAKGDVANGVRPTTSKRRVITSCTYGNMCHGRLINCLLIFDMET
jgi:hypothetical protein